MVMTPSSPSPQRPLDKESIRLVAKAEKVDPTVLARHVGGGSVVIMRRGDRCVGIGRGLRIKVNVNIGTSNVRSVPHEEVKKAVVAEHCGADTISDLSMGRDVEETRRLIFSHTSVPITTVPVYQAAAEQGIEGMDARDILDTVRRQAREGVSSMVVHCIIEGHPGGVQEGGTCAWARVEGRIHHCGVHAPPRLPEPVHRALPGDPRDHAVLRDSALPRELGTERVHR